MKIPVVFSLLFLCLAINYARATGKLYIKLLSKGGSSFQLHGGTAGAGLYFRTGMILKYHSAYTSYGNFLTKDLQPGHTYEMIDYYRSYSFTFTRKLDLQDTISS